MLCWIWRQTVLLGWIWGVLIRSFSNFRRAGRLCHGAAGRFPILVTDTSALYGTWCKMRGTWTGFFLGVLRLPTLSTILPVPHVYMFIDHKRCIFWISVSQNFLLADPFWLGKPTTDPFWRTYWVPEWHVSSIKNLYFGTDFRLLVIYTSSIRNNTVHDLTLIQIIVARVVGTGFFLK
jgi:hypothetical protein